MGLGNSGNGENPHLLFDYDESYERIDARDLERGSIDNEEARQTIEEEIMSVIPADHPDRERLIAEAIENERRLQQDLRAAGLL